MTRYFLCPICGYLYPPKDSDATGQNAPVDFERLPENWECPLCGNEKENFTEIRNIA